MGTLFIVSTPIGNLDDISIRALHTLASVDCIACEDTRRTGILLGEIESRHPDVLTRSIKRKPSFIRYDNQTEIQRTPELIEHLKLGTTVALVTDAGTPLIADPGFRLVREAQKNNIPVVSVPGASAILTALTLSGLSADAFLFLGFPPEKTGNRERQLAWIKTLTSIHTPPTIIYYISPHKFRTFLTDIQTVIGDIPIVVARELTKVHEEMWKGTVSEALLHFPSIKGEIVLLWKPTN